MKLLPCSLLLVSLLCTAPTLKSAEYFVAPGGNDSKNGSTKEQAFATLQKGLEALSPGDTLTITPGEYFGSAQRTGLGSAEKDTLIRAEIPGTVLLRGDVRAPIFKKVADKQFVYVADFDGEVQAVNEVDTLSRFTPPVPSANDLEFMPGGYFYDPGEKKLYISTSDLQPPDQHTYTISVTPQSGVTLIQPTRVIIEGLAATGYNTNSIKPLKAEDQMGTVWGFWMDNPKDCIVRECTFFLNGGGIGVSNDRKGENRGNTIIEKSVVYGNDSPFVSSGGVVVYFPNNEVIRDCLAYRTDKYAFRFYQRGNGTALMERNIATSGEMAIKGNALPEMSQMNSCVGLENMDSPTLKNSILGEQNRRSATEKDPHTIFLGEEAKLDWNLEFADPQNADFRLQSTSRFRSNNGKPVVRGPHPFAANVFFVSPAGNDEADGLSLKTAWKTLSHATKLLKAGDTLYLSGGIYRDDLNLTLKGTDKEPIFIRGRGNDPVGLEGNILVTDSTHLKFERLQFSKPVSANNGSDLNFTNCVFSGSVTNFSGKGVKELRITHSVFTRFQASGVFLQNCAGVFLAGNIYDNHQGSAVTAQEPGEIHYSDYNSYAEAKDAWCIEGKMLALDEWQKTHDHFSQVLSPKFSETNDIAKLSNVAHFAGKGPLGTDLGISRRERSRELKMAGPMVHSVSTTTANIEWQATGPATCEIAWGLTPDCPNKETLDINYWGAWSLTGLKPGTTYYFQIRSMQSQTELAETKKQIPTGINTLPISFTTALKDQAPQTYYVSTQGDDENSGVSQDQAWRTISKAANRVNVGDTVLVGAGEYPEIIRVRATGTGEAPILFQALPKEKVTISGANKRLKNLFVIHGKNHIQVDHFYFKDVNPLGGSQRQPVSMAAVFNVAYAKDVKITRCLYEGRGGGYSPAFLTASFTDNLLVKNCVVIAPMHGLYVMASKGFQLENNVFLRCQIGTLHASDGRNKQMRISGNIFTDSLAYKPNGTVMEVPVGAVVEENNCYFLRTGEARKAIRIAQAEKADEDGPLFAYAEASKLFKTQKLSLVKNPQFRAFQKLTDKDIANLKEMNERPDNQAKGRIYYPVDLLIDGEGVPLDFPDLFITDKDAVNAGIGLMPDAFTNQK